MEKFNPLVSIVIPVYNGENYVKEAIDSALKQTYKNIEVIVVNDGSTDRTEEICKSYGNKIRYFKKENGGASSALNFAIEKMNGDYFSWLSHDDLYYEYKIEKQIDYLKTIKNKNCVIYNDYELIDEKGKYLYQVNMDHDDLIKNYYKALSLGCLNGITLLIPKQAFADCGKFDINLRCTQDYDMWQRIILKYRFYHMKDIITKTRLHANQDSNTSPYVITEGNKLWENILFNIPENEMKKNFGNKLNYYKTMYNFLKQTPYDLVTSKCKKILEEIESDISSVTIKDVISVFVNLNKENINNIKNILLSVINQTYKYYDFYIIYDKKIPAKVDNIFNFYNIKYKVLKKANMIDLKKIKGKYISIIDNNVILNGVKFENQINELYTSDCDCVFSTYYNTKYYLDVLISSDLCDYENAKKININAGIFTKDFLIKNNITIDSLLNCDFFDIYKVLKIAKYKILPMCLFNCNCDLFTLKDKNAKEYYKLLENIFTNNLLYAYQVDMNYIINDLAELLNYKNNNYTVFDELDRIYNSKSWKITSIFRKIRKKLR